MKNGQEIKYVKEQVTKKLERTEDVTLEYFEVAESKNLNVLERVNGAEKPILCIAGYVGEVRLIDNMFLN